MILSLVIGSSAAACAGLLAVRAGALTVGGAAAATAVGGLVFAAGGLGWSAVLLVFFLTSSALSRLPGLPGVSDIAAKSDRRDAFQVLTNGGPASLYALLALIWPSSHWLVGFTGCLAAATADTWATEIGSRSTFWPVHITTFRPVPPGTSGAVTPRGLLASLAGALTISIAACLVAGLPAPSLPALALAGLAASLIDSLLGATVQEVRYCSICQVRTEQEIHRRCGSQTFVIRGVRGFDNDAVNAMATFSGGLIGLLSTALP